MISRFRGTDGGQGQADLGMISQMRGYWEALRDDGGLPDRHRIDPRGIAAALEHSFLVERIGAGLARFRIAGMAFHDLCGMDVRGMPVSCLFVGEARLRLQVEMERMFHSPAVLTLGLCAKRGMVKPPLKARMIFLPVRGPKQDGALALGCIEILGDIGHSPRRFEIEGSRLDHIALDSASTAQEIDPVPMVPQPEIRPARPPAGSRYLRLVSTND